ncbi:MAG: sugar phosphate isomerase/epimerase [Verrucomicrobia bacterium]|nr:sugar phosphate isomerase/epimerase [Verrucomicrobiota bacterium]
MFKNLSPTAVGIKANLQQSIDLARRFGFGGVDLPVAEIATLADQRGAQAIRDQFTAAGLKPGAFGCPVNFRADEATWETGLASLPRLAKAAAAVGGTRCTSSVPPASDALDHAANFELHVSRLEPIARVLKDHGIRFGIEFIGPKTARRGKKHEFIWNMEGALELCDAIGTGNVGLTLDSWHWHTSHATLDDIRKLKPEDVVCVHVNDAPRGIAVDELPDQPRELPAATGVIDLKGFLNALKEIGYDGPVTAEPFRKDLAAMPADQTAKLVAEAMDKLWAAAGF